MHLVSAKQSRERRLSFARQYFGGCPAHTEEAVAVHRVVEVLAREHQADVAPDTTIAEIVDQGPLRPSPADDSLDLVEFVMTLEEEIGATIPDGDDERTWEPVMFRVLLGSHAILSTWAPETIHCRSIRGIIEERVRLRGDCSCGTAV
jgi:hypothetical protein